MTPPGEFHQGTGFEVRRSAMDASVNFSRPTPDGGMVETRFVRRIGTRFIVYISSMTGCDKACRFCFLTQTGQTMAANLDVDAMVDQAATVLSSSEFREGETVHFNFMARGEPMSNPHVGRALFERLRDLALSHCLSPRVKISTIMPDDLADRDWSSFDVPGIPVDIYYSLYSTDVDWRRRWIPKALPVGVALDVLTDFQRRSGQRVILHWALIEDENDGVDAARSACSAAVSAGLSFDFNLVRYNPANDKSAEAPRERIDEYLAAVREYTGEGRRVREIARVGFDVAASCGMFLGTGRRGKSSIEDVAA